MPRLFTYNEFKNGSEKVRQYADKHSPVIICESTAERNKPFRVKVKIGKSVKHPNAPDHHYEYIQLWNLETLVGEIKLQRSSFGDLPVHIEAEFTIIPKTSPATQRLELNPTSYPTPPTSRAQAPEIGRSGGVRTPGPRFWRPMLYQLSYTPKVPVTS